MLSIRRTKTASKATAIQIVRYENRKVVVVKHIGSAHTSSEVIALEQSAEAWKAEYIKQSSLFPKAEARVISLATAQYEKSLYLLTREVLLKIAEKCGFCTVCNSVFLDLVVMRIVEPASKLRSIMLLNEYFGISYSRDTVYRSLPIIAKQKSAVENIAVSFAKNELGTDLSLVLYDVTTLYFETFESDELRVPGFSKDNKSQQPQIVIGLLVTQAGFPLGYEIFKGNTFEGKTMLPVVKTFMETHGVTTPIIVADAAMISRENVAKLNDGGFSYIVGARIANCSQDMITHISSTLKQEDGASMRCITKQGDLICAFSKKRYRKDLAEMEKQIEKAKKLIEKGEPGKRAKFVKHNANKAYVFDEGLLAKAKALLGIKGYYTNIPIDKMSNDEVITRYRDLWHVEAAFRMSKNDLATRPIFHYKEESIKAHMVICFVALAIGKYLEIQTGLSLRKVIDTCWTVTDAHISDTVTGEQFILRSKIGTEVRTILKKLGLSY